MEHTNEYETDEYIFGKDDQGFYMINKTLKLNRTNLMSEKSSSQIVHEVFSKIRKGLVRSTVLKQLSVLKNSVEQLTEGREIKKKEIQEYKMTDKGAILIKQVEILDEAIGHIKETILVLSSYKKLTTSQE